MMKSRILSLLLLVLGNVVHAYSQEKVTISGTKSHTAFPEIEIEDDEHSNGNIMQESYSHEDLKPGDQVDFKIYTIK